MRWLELLAREEWSAHTGWTDRIRLRLEFSGDDGVVRERRPADDLQAGNARIAAMSETRF